MTGPGWRQAVAERAAGNASQGRRQSTAAPARGTPYT